MTVNGRAGGRARARRLVHIGHGGLDGFVLRIADADAHTGHRGGHERPDRSRSAEPFDQHRSRSARTAPVRDGPDSALGMEGEQSRPLSGDEHARTHIQAEAGEVDPPDDVFERFSADPPGRECLQPRLS